MQLSTPKCFTHGFHRAFQVVGCFVCVCLVTACGTVESSTDYRNRPVAIVFPIINDTDRTLIKSAFFDAHTAFGFTGPLERQGILVVFSNEVSTSPTNKFSRPPISAETLVEMRQGKRPPDSGLAAYDYAMLLSIDSFTITTLASTRKIAFTLFVWEPKKNEPVRKYTKTFSRWRGILGGPLDAVLEVSGNESGLQNALAKELSESVTAMIREAIPSMGGKLR